MMDGGNGASVTRRAYDAADRVKTMTYPGGEVVTTVYNAQGLPETLAGTNTYVTSVDHDALGRTELLNLGNSRQINNVYYPVRCTWVTVRRWDQRRRPAHLDERRLRRHGLDLRRPGAGDTGEQDRQRQRRLQHLLHLRRRRGVALACHLTKPQVWV